MSTQATHPELSKVPSQSVLSSYRDIAVALTETPGDHAAVNAAITLARGCGARLDLLQVLLMPTPLVDAWSLVPDTAFIEAYNVIRGEAKVKANVWREHMKHAMVSGEVHALEALYLEPSSLAAEAARCGDLVVIAGPAAHDGDTTMLKRYFAGLLFETGLPVLMIPPGFEAYLPAHRAVVAWADTRECVRAVHDALPMLRACESVSVATVRAGRTSDPGDLVELLKKHGVAAEATPLSLTGDETIADRLMEHASRTHAQLIVAGGYGHSRLREWAIGGVTRDLLTRARIPVLFSH
ncbi:MAG: universal stress protein [Luteibacter sp.]